MKEFLSDDIEEPVKKRNRRRKKSPRRHKIVHESGRSIKSLWRKIIERSRKQG